MKIKFHFFGKDCIIDRPLKERDNLKLALSKHGFKAQHTLFVNQIHSAEVVVIDDAKKIYGEQDLPKADAIVANQKNIAVGVITADCSPVLLFDEKAGIIAAAHAGWRGAKLGVLENVVAEMKKLGATNIEALIGPMIQQESYEVSQEFFDDFVRDNSVNKKFFIAGKESGKFQFDLPSYVEEKLVFLGARVANCRIDTYKNEEKFFSFRRSTHRNEQNCGRNISIIEIGE